MYIIDSTFIPNPTTYIGGAVHVLRTTLNYTTSRKYYAFP